MPPTLSALLRFAWLVLLGAAVALVAGVALYRHQPKPTYIVSANVLVNSPAAPYLRTAQPAVPITSTRTKPGTKPGTKKKPTKSTVSTASAPTPPDTQVLVNAANLYPLLIQSDVIAKLRRETFGATPGTVTATALASSTNTYGVYHPSPLPVITVKARSLHPAQGKRLVTQTISTFEDWIVARQKAAGVAPAQRISVEALQTTVKATNKASNTMPIFVGVVILVAFGGLAVLLDGIRPRKAGAPEAAAPEGPTPAPAPHQRVA
jgi:hypothetical protein